MDAASPRARPTVATITTTAVTARTTHSQPPATRVSRSTMIPRMPPTTGLATMIVGSDAVSAPAR